MNKNTSAVYELIERAAREREPSGALHLSQSACNVANAIMTLTLIDREKKATGDAK